MKLLILVVAFASVTYADVYGGSELLEVVANSPSQQRFLIDLRAHYDFWKLPTLTGGKGSILAYKDDVETLKRTLIKAGIEFKVLSKDVGQIVLSTWEEHEAARKKAPMEGKSMEWSSYHTYDEINDWLDSLAVDYPSLVTVTDVGTSYEGSTMKFVKVSTGGEGKPSLFIDGGIHAREWIASATVTYMMNELITNSATYQSSLDAVDFYFMPCINPDGYNYSMANSDNRLWRKTRSPNPDSGIGCVGTDANRNWDFQWDVSGSSGLACSEVYEGSQPFSEVEMRNVRDQMLSHPSVIYLTYHSYGQYLLHPWGYEASYPDNYDELESLGKAAAAAILGEHGKTYQVGGSGTLLSVASGASDDYAMGVGNYEFSYTVELRDTGATKFELPPREIIPTGEESFAGFRVFFEFVRDNRT